jgi:fatty acid desaturase
MLELGYTILFVTLISIILWYYHFALKKIGVKSKKRILIVVIILALWLIIQYLITKTGFYSNLSVSPRIPIFMITPLLFFTFIFLVKNRNNYIVDVIPIHIPIAYQSFRVVIEVLFYFTYIKGILPVQVTFEGINYDVLFGMSAILMGIYAYQKNASKKVLIAWNIIGICVVVFAAFTFITSFYFPSIWGESNSRISPDFVHFPFLLLPAFFMPSAIFMHVLSIIQLRE